MNPNTTTDIKRRPARHRTPADTQARDCAYHCPMCGRAYETYTEEELAFQYLNHRPLHLEGFRANYNLAPTQQSPVVLVRNGEPTIELFRWGLVPSWAKSLEAAAKYSLINARGEEIADKRSYAQPFKRRRCVVPLSGFFEWKRGGGYGSPRLPSIERTDASSRWPVSGNAGSQKVTRPRYTPSRS